LDTSVVRHAAWVEVIAAARVFRGCSGRAAGWARG